MDMHFPSPVQFIRRAGLIFVLAFAPATSADAAENLPAEFNWPPVTKETRPWTYWWWMGSAVNPAELTRHLEAYRKAGMGGVHIVPIYGAKGYEDRYINYLTPEWMEMLAHTVKEADRVGMGVDMTAGTGWPYGGPWVGPKDAAAKVLFETYTVAAGVRLGKPVRSTEQPKAALQTLMAFSKGGDALDLTGKVDELGSLAWTAPTGDWTLYAVFQGWTKQQVKRAAPGAEGNVLDYFSTASLKNYLARFDKAFAGYDARPPRGFYNDSYEVYRANWTDNLFDEFQNRRRYDLRLHLPALLGKGFADVVARVRSDYRETIHDLLLEAFTIPWVAWCHQKGAVTRNQAHGSPGNILDLYAAADIPETEGFGRHGAEILVSKFASSAAHVARKPLVSSESCTWLDEHFQVSLAQAKPAIDQLFVAGINHIFYHGMTFSPADAGYPGWLFYASTNFGLSNSFWPHVAGLNGYIARCQSFLQAGRPDNDLLLYFPIYDLWHKDHGAKNLLQYLQVHNSKPWLQENLASTHTAAKTMWDRGYTFDYVSDGLLAGNVSATPQGLRADDVAYRALILPACTFIQPETLENILVLAEKGATVIVLDTLPSDVPGLTDLANRRKELKQILATIKPTKTKRQGIRQANVGRGRILIGENLESLLQFISVRRERLTDLGLEFVRRSHTQGYHYFLANLTDQPIDGWVPLGTDAKSAVLFDPIRTTRGLAALRRQPDEGLQVRLQLQPGESVILRTLHKRNDGPGWPYLTPKGRPEEITGTWDVTFTEGGPTLPKGFQTERLASWTEIGPPEARAFSGTARYTITFSKPSSDADLWYLDLGRVCESASVKLNGRDLAILWCRPYQTPVPASLLKPTNKLEIEVTNLMANRIADMDRRKIGWRKYFFVNINYKPFDASGWQPMSSGLVGPVRMIPCAAE